MAWLDWPRVPEPEVMDDSGEVEAYSSAAAQSHLSEIDDTFIAHAERLLGTRISSARAGRVLDIGAGPGQIARKLAKHLPGWLLLGVDRSPNMIREARVAQRAEEPPSDTANLHSVAEVEFLVADANRLPFPDASFDLVLCNSVLHHLENPAQLLAEIARVAKPDGAILARDLSRPSRIAYPFHARWYGRHYSGTMRRLYRDSLRAAYTFDELASMLQESPLRDQEVRVFRRNSTHLGLERAAR
jgi:ubiquinone/menaquinone biosynthesis C-methylase UbiE